MRILAVTGVIAVHAITLVDTSQNVAAGTALMVLHTSRAVFFAVMAAVLAYNYRDGILTAGRRWASLWRFWRRRYLLVVVPYVVWTVIYFIADGIPLHPVSDAVRTLSLDLVTGGARYHLYFLLVTMQMYLVFPLVIALVRWSRGFHWLVFLLALAYQLLFSQAVHAGWALPGALGFWVRNPDSFLPSYVLYILTGALLADHLERTQALVRRWWPVAILITVAGSALALGVYSYAINHLQQVPTLAAEVFQPALTIENLTATLGLFTLGVAWEAVLRPRWLRAVISNGADSSFGIFLAHPLVLQAIIVVITALGVLRAVTNLRFSAALAVAVVVVTPVVLILTWLIVLVLRR
ncbi:MAG: acyltransferase, partial [Candidatus Dormibacteraeota bacterium]|nr:acyltransferase [Candidatus Dormibacteraeota bacterium]